MRLYVGMLFEQFYVEEKQQVIQQLYPWGRGSLAHWCQATPLCKMTSGRYNLIIKVKGQGEAEVSEHSCILTTHTYIYIPYFFNQTLWLLFTLYEDC